MIGLECFQRRSLPPPPFSPFQINFSPVEGRRLVYCTCCKGYNISHTRQREERFKRKISTRRQWKSGFSIQLRFPPPPSPIQFPISSPPKKILPFRCTNLGRGGRRAWRICPVMRGRREMSTTALFPPREVVSVEEENGIELQIFRREIGEEEGGRSEIEKRALIALLLLLPPSHTLSHNLLSPFTPGEGGRKKGGISHRWEGKKKRREEGRGGGGGTTPLSISREGGRRLADEEGVSKGRKRRRLPSSPLSFAGFNPPSSSSFSGGGATISRLSY